MAPITVEDGGGGDAAAGGVDPGMSLHNVPAMTDLRFTMEAIDALEASLLKQEEELKEGMKARAKKYRKLHKTNKGQVKEVMHNVLWYQKKTEAKLKQLNDVIFKRDQALQDLRNVEQAFSDVHRKYERSKQVLENLKANETMLMRRDEDIQMMIYSRDQKFEAFKQESNDVLERMYHDFVAKTSALDQENARLAAKLRRSEMRVEALECELDQQLKENNELNGLVDDLIGKTPRMMV